MRISPFDNQGRTNIEATYQDLLAFATKYPNDIGQDIIDNINVSAGQAGHPGRPRVIAGGGGRRTGALVYDSGRGTGIPDEYADGGVPRFRDPDRIVDRGPFPG